MSTLYDRTAYAYQWINKYLTDVPTERWEETPPQLASNVTWQLGHLTLSAYYHSIMVVTGHQPDLLARFPLGDYSKLFHRTKAADALGIIGPTVILQHWQLVTEQSLRTIRELPPEELPRPLVPHPYPHPVATTKEEALEWNVLHNHYHWGQLGMIRRALLAESFDYWSGNLKK